MIASYVLSLNGVLTAQQFESHKPHLVISSTRWRERWREGEFISNKMS